MTGQKNQPSFGEAYAELERITEELEQEALDLDTAIEKFERGLVLSQYLKRTLKSAEQRVEKIRARFDAVDAPDDAEA